APRPRSSRGSTSRRWGPRCERPRWRSPTRWTAGARRMSPARSTRPPAGSAPTARPTGGCSARWSATFPSRCPRSSRRSCVRFPGTRSPWPGSAWTASCPSACWRGGFAPTGPPGRSPAWPAPPAPPLPARPPAGYGLWSVMLPPAGAGPVVEGASARLIAALVAELASLGGQVETGRWVRSLDSLPRARAILLDVTPRQLAAMAGGPLPGWQGRALARFRYGPGVCKVDWALSGPVPWEAAPCREAGTLHVGGTLGEVARSEAEVNKGRHAERPFCLIAQPGVVDPSRAPAGRQTLWGYCHVPSGSDADMSGRIEAQIERFAPGFKDLILAKSV